MAAGQERHCAEEFTSECVIRGAKETRRKQQSCIDLASLKPCSTSYVLSMMGDFVADIHTYFDRQAEACASMAAEVQCDVQCRGDVLQRFLQGDREQAAAAPASMAAQPYVLIAKDKAQSFTVFNQAPPPHA